MIIAASDGAGGVPLSPIQTEVLPRTEAIAETGVRVSPFEIAQQIQEVRVENLKLVLSAQTRILDLLV